MMSNLIQTGKYSNQLYNGSNIVMKKSFDFSLHIIVLYKKLIEKNEFVISKQILKSATSIGANIMESKYGASKKDFLHKITISLKEANETLYRLELLKQSELFSIDYTKYIKEINEILAILNKIVTTTKKNLQKN